MIQRSDDMARESKYHVITDWLRQTAEPVIRTSIDGLEETVGIKFPPYVRVYPWGNDRTQPLSRSWMAAGYIVSQSGGTITFAHNPERATELLNGTKRAPNTAGTRTPTRLSRRKQRRDDIPLPSETEVDKYLRLWNSLEDYRLQESALDKLFLTACPQNTDMDDILVKVSCLNEFYSTNIYSLFAVARHIQELDIDERLRASDPTLVENIASITISGKPKVFYSFATKYCSHHQPLDYAIWDSYVDEVLKYFRDVDGFSDFAKDDLKQYSRFKDVLFEFRSFYGLERYNLKELDKYLWQLGKDRFPQKRFQKRKQAFI